MEEKGNLSGKLPVSEISIFPTKLGNYGQIRKIKKVKKSLKIGKRAGGVSQPGFLKGDDVRAVQKPGLSAMWFCLPSPFVITFG